MKHKNSMLAAITALCLLGQPLLPVLPEVTPTLIAYAEESGTIGENLTWTLDDEGTLTISGEGDMANYTTPLDYDPDSDPVNSPFYQNTAIKKVIIQPGVKSIGAAVFYDCDAITSVSIPDSVTNIRDYGFFGCKSLTEVTLPDTLETIGVDAFTVCNSLTEITIPASVKRIGQGGFPCCPSLKEIKVSPENTEYTSVDGVLYSKDMKTLISYPGAKKGAFTIPDGVTAIDFFAFCYCFDLTAVVIPESMTSIGEYLFDECPCLIAITIPESVTEIASLAFMYLRDDLTIYGKAGSYAETYAKNQNYSFVAGEAPESPAAELTPGDVNCDGMVDIMDVIKVNKFILGIGNFADSQLKAADVNKDEDVNSSDSLLILKFALDMIQTFD